MATPLSLVCISAALVSNFYIMLVHVRKRFLDFALCFSQTRTNGYQIHLGSVRPVQPRVSVLLYHPAM
jgi:hypothetical protein